MIHQGDSVFVDSNVLIHIAVKHSQCHQKAVQALDKLEDNGCILCISRQILREYMVYVTRPQSNLKPVPLKLVITQINDFLKRFQIKEDNNEVTSKLLKLLQEIPIGGKKIHDANIVATMLTYGVSNLLTYNIDDFKRFSAHITILKPDSF